MATPKQYNILFLGETQSGKSTLIESLKKYADPNYEVDQDKIGRGTHSCTADVITRTITTNLPSCYVSDADSGERIDYGNFIHDMDIEDYEDELNDRKSYRLDREQTDAPNVNFNLIDTPGLNDTKLFDETNLGIIFEALKSIEAIHLVVVTVSNNPFTEGLKKALRAYVQLLPAFNGNFVFVHTNTDYGKLHPENKQFGTSLDEKKVILHRFLKRDSVPHLLIDNDLKSRKTIRVCITQNTLRNILAMAKLNQPVGLHTMMMNKTEKMLEVDAYVCNKIEGIIQKREETLGSKNEKEKEILKRENDLKALITDKEQKLKDNTNWLNLHDQSTLELLYEEWYQQDFSILNLAERSKEMFYPSKKLSNSSGFIHHKLDHIDVRSHNIKLLREAGGVNEKFWAVKFRRRKAQNGVYHVKIYITKKKKFEAEIDRLKGEQISLKGLLDDHQADLDDFMEVEKENRKEIQLLLDELKKNRYILSRVSSEQVDNKVFDELVKNNVYVRDYSESARNVENFYGDNKDMLEALERNEGYVPPPVVSTSEDSNDTGLKDVSDQVDCRSMEFEDATIKKQVHEILAKEVSDMRLHCGKAEE